MHFMTQDRCSTFLRNECINSDSVTHRTFRYQRMYLLLQSSLQKSHVFPSSSSVTALVQVCEQYVQLMQHRPRFLVKSCLYSKMQPLTERLRIKLSHTDTTIYVYKQKHNIGYNAYNGIAEISDSVRLVPPRNVTD